MSRGRTRPGPGCRRDESRVAARLRARIIGVRHGSERQGVAIAGEKGDVPAVRKGSPEGPSTEHPSFLGLRRAGFSQLVIKKSRFLGYAWPVEDVREAEERLQDLRAEHPDATHVCYAYRVGLGTEDVRFSDDGEPGGTAGKPILEVMIQTGVRNALVAVVRYFGGILLGAPGLVRAYSQAAAQALTAAQPAEMIPHRTLEIRVSYPLLGKVRHLLGQLGAVEEDAAFAEQVILRVVLPQARGAVWARQAENLGPEVAWSPREDILYRPQPEA